jgi:hypothetical protein
MDYTEGLPEDITSRTVSDRGKQTEPSTDRHLGEPDLPGQSLRDKVPTERADKTLEVNMGLMQFQIALLRKLTPGVWITSEVITRWISGQSQYDP